MSSQIVKIILHNPAIFNGYFCFFMNTAKILQSCAVSGHRCIDTLPAQDHRPAPGSLPLFAVDSGKCHRVPAGTDPRLRI